MMRDVAAMNGYHKNFMSVPEIHKAIGALCSQKTIQRDVADMVSVGMLEKAGNKRHTHYKLKSRNT